MNSMRMHKSVVVFILMRFRPVHDNTICMRFRFDSLSRAFSNRCDENAQRISEDGRPKALKVCVFKRCYNDYCGRSADGTSVIDCSLKWIPAFPRLSDKKVAKCNSTGKENYEEF